MSKIPQSRTRRIGLIAGGAALTLFLVAMVWLDNLLAGGVEIVMSQEMVLQSITAIYAVCNAVRLLFYVPQMIAVARERSGAHAISIITWMFWSFSHAVTAIYCYAVVHDLLLSGMMWGNAFGCAAVVILTVAKRRRYGWSRGSSGE